jgi:predicted DNA-binding transcriptional regulator AlpA
MVPAQLLNLSDIGRLLGVSRQRAAQLAQHAEFPEPAGEMGRGKVWRAKDIEKWARATGRL